MYHGIAIGLALALLTGPAAASDLPAPLVPEEPIPAELVLLNGSGCPKGTALVNVSDDKTAFTVTYLAYQAEAGKGVALQQARKNCQLMLDVTVPEGYTYAITKAVHHGSATLAEGATAAQRSNVYFQGMAQTGYLQNKITGPLDDAWEATNIVDVASLIFHPCGEPRYLAINTELRVTAPANTPAAQTVNSVRMDDLASTDYWITWRRC